MSHYLKHNLTKKALGDHLFIVRLALYSNIKELKRHQQLWSKYVQLKSEFTKILVCPKKKCPAILVMKKEKVEEPEQKQPCWHTFIKNTHQACFIFRMPFEKKLKYFVQHHGMKHQKWDSYFRGDIQSGGIYKILEDDGRIDDKTISVVWNKDGAQPLKITRTGFGSAF